MDAQSTTADAPQVARDPMNGTLVIDTDVHETCQAEDLVPYLEPKWRRYITEYGWQPDYNNPYGIPSTGGVYRLDARPAGGEGGSEIGLLQRQLFDEAGIKFCMLSGPLHLNPSNLHRSWPEFKTALATAYNEWEIANWLNADRRMLGSIHVNAHDPAGAVREIERLAPNPRMVQVMIYLGTTAFGEPQFHPIYEAAERHGLVVAFHQGSNAATTFGYHRYYIEWKASLPQVFMSTLISLIFNGVFEKYPNLKTIMIEGGFTWVPHLMSRLDQHLRQLQNEVPWVKRYPSDQIRSQVGFATQPMEEMTASQFMTFVDQMGSEDLLLYSSDYPHWDFDSPSEALPEGLPDDLRMKVLHKNALTLYGDRMAAQVPHQL